VPLNTTGTAATPFVFPGAVGSYTVTATYNPTPNFADASGPSSITSNVANATSLAIATSATSVVAGTAVTFTAVVTSNAFGSTPQSGRVDFYDNGVLIGTALLTSQTATTATYKFTTSTLATGTHTITARYTGDPNFNAAVSNNLTQTISAKAGRVTG
jgi:hypothetical protein